MTTEPVDNTNTAATRHLIDSVLDDIAARMIADCNHAEAGMQYPCCEPCWDRSRTVLSLKYTKEGTH